MNKLSDLFTYPLNLVFENNQINYDFLQEIRMRTGQPLMVSYEGKYYFVKTHGNLSSNKEYAVAVDNKMLTETIQIFSSYSLYAFEDELRQGFLTIPGGHRVGICGKVVIENKAIKTIKDISSINVRIAHQVKGCGDKVVDSLYCNNSFYNTLIVSSPGGGKTTLLRDLIRQISDGSDIRRGMTVGIVDERSEIAACYRGVPQNDVGMRTDVLDCCPKYEGMLMLIRSMSPEIIAVDEIGHEKDYEALLQAVYCGIKLIATVHGSSFDELLRKPMLKQLIEQNIFERIIILKEKNIECILDVTGKDLLND